MLTVVKSSIIYLVYIPVRSSLPYCCKRILDKLNVFHSNTKTFAGSANKWFYIKENFTFNYTKIKFSALQEIKLNKNLDLSLLCYEDVTKIIATWKDHHIR